MNLLRKIKNYILYFQSTNPFDNIAVKVYPYAYSIVLDTEQGPLSQFVLADRYKGKESAQAAVDIWFAEGYISEMPVPLEDYVMVTPIWETQSASASEEKQRGI